MLHICMLLSSQLSRRKPDLFCRMVSDHPSLILSPARVEIVLEDPEISVFHDVVTEAEAERIRLLAQSKV